MWLYVDYNKNNIIKIKIIWYICRDWLNDDFKNYDNDNFENSY
jgi:hypothetical protein